MVIISCNQFVAQLPLQLMPAQPDWHSQESPRRCVRFVFGQLKASQTLGLQSVILRHEVKAIENGLTGNFAVNVAKATRALALSRPWVAGPKVAAWILLQAAVKALWTLGTFVLQSLQRRRPHRLVSLAQEGCRWPHPWKKLILKLKRNAPSPHSTHSNVLHTIVLNQYTIGL